MTTLGVYPNYCTEGSDKRYTTQILKSLGEFALRSHSLTTVARPPFRSGRFDELLACSDNRAAESFGGTVLAYA
jgi:hypothetical protein